MARIYGFHPLREALRHRPHEVRQVLLATTSGSPRRREIEALCRKAQVPVGPFSDALRRELEGVVHNGFVAQLELSTSEAAADDVNSAGADATLTVLLEDVQDPRNLGAILRVCEGAGVGSVLIRDRGSAPLSEAAMKTSAGAAQWLDVERVTNSAQEIERLRGAGHWVWGAAAEGVPAWEVDLTGPLTLCFGGEAKGLRRRTRSVCDGLIAVPMRGRVESLNVATACAAILYEAVRQRLVAEKKS